MAALCSNYKVRVAHSWSVLQTSASASSALICKSNFSAAAPTTSSMASAGKEGSVRIKSAVNEALRAARVAAEFSFARLRVGDDAPKCSSMFFKARA